MSIVKETIYRLLLHLKHCMTNEKLQATLITKLRMQFNSEEMIS